jgi:acetoin utilization deacetylase AcuC-like enzyme
MKTGLVYDDIFLKHEFPTHPENFARLNAVVTYLKDRKLFDRCVSIEARPAREEELLTCHNTSLIELLKIAGIGAVTFLGRDTFVNSFSYRAATTAAGGAIELAAKITSGELSSGIILSRPPGHHATPTRAMGFCLLNTIAIAARSCVLSMKLNRVAIVDIDVHHGNGTQEIFYNDPKVLYISTHAYPLYPGTGSAEQTGQGEAVGTTINIPFPASTGDKGYERAAGEIIVPALERFGPEIIFVSVGFDAHPSDPLSPLKLSLSGYDRICSALIHAANAICNGRIIFSLEGGYNPDVLAPGVGNIVRRLLADSEIEDPFPHDNSEENVDALIDSIKKLHNL